MTLTHWYIELEGSDRDLQRLRDLDVEGWEITEFRGVYSLTSPEFEGMADLLSVKDKAEHVVSMLNGAADLYFGGYKHVRAGEPYGIRPDGSRTHFVYSAHSNVASATTLSVDDVEPVVPDDPPTGIFGVTLAVCDHPNVQRVLRDLQRDDLWTLRYRRVYESIRKDVDPSDERVLDKRGWVPQSQYDRFSNTIYNDSAIGAGDDALHVNSANTTGAPPMTRDEAKDFIYSLVRTWLRWKYANQAHAS